MHEVKLRCASCKWEGPLGIQYQCPECGGSLEVIYDYSAVNRDRVDKALDTYRGVWSFMELLPLRNEENIITMNEGGTPLYRSMDNIGCTAYWKDETRNPTLSFKDRPNTVGISVAKERGYQDVSIASTGNGGASLSAYAVRGGMKCHICIPKTTPQGKVLQADYHGAELILCDGDYSKSYEVNKKLSEEKRWANLTSTYLNPYTMEGDKTIAYEIFAELGRKVPDWIAVPLGAGAMLTGIYKGFCELRELGFCDKVPRMIGVQAEGCAPIIDAWLRREPAVAAWKDCSTIAGAIADPLEGYESDGTRTLQTIYKSEGYGVKVPDQEIKNWVKRLADTDGLLVEPASAVAAYAIYDLAERQVIKGDDVAVGIITAHGLKDSEELEQMLKDGDSDEIRE